MKNRVRVGKKSKCVAAKGRLQGWADTLLLLCVGIFHFSFLSLSSKLSVVQFFQLAPNECIN